MQRKVLSRAGSAAMIWTIVVRRVKALKHGRQYSFWGQVVQFFWERSFQWCWCETVVLS